MIPLGNYPGKMRFVSAQIQEKPIEGPVPNWLNRILDSKARRGLFGAGAGLILITFIFFTFDNKKHQENANDTPHGSKFPRAKS